MNKKNTAILLFDAVGVLDFAGPFEVFSFTNELNDYTILNIYGVSAGIDMSLHVNGLLYGKDEAKKQPDILNIKAYNKPLHSRPGLGEVESALDRGHFRLTNKG